MPGRQSTAAPRKSKPLKAKRQNQKRSLNALATASQQDPEISKIKRHRLGETEQDNVKRKREVPQDEVDDGGDIRTSKRQRAGARDRFGNKIEGGSDSEGNVWTLGHVDTNDDSDLDSDEAMGESDEERFEGFTFRGSLQKKPPVTRKGTVRAKRNMRNELHDIDLQEAKGDQVGSGDESDDFAEDAVDLVAMLDASEDEERELQASYSKVKGRDKASNNRSSNSKNQAIDAEASAEDQGSELSISEDEASTNSIAKLSALQMLVSSLSDGKSMSSTHRLPLHNAQENATPSDFGLNPRQKLTVADLLPSVTDTRLKKSLKLMSNDVDPKTSTKRIPGKLEVPLAKRQQDRLDRAAAYEKSKEVLNRWIDTVKQNRRAEHLSFPLLDPDVVAANCTNRLPPTAHSKPLTDLESTIQSILQESGLAPTGNRSQEDQLQAFEELQTNRLPLEEVRVRRAELRKARELMFREEIRAKRIKKIKSKSYRRVHRKEREKIASHEKGALAAAGVDLSGDEQERNDRQRAEERMGARHRESKWARSVKATGRAVWNEDARDGVLEMAEREEDLKRRILGKETGEDEEESVSSSTGSENEDDMSGEDAQRRSRERLYRHLEQPNRSRESLGSGGNGTRSTLASMKFMQKAEEARKKQNDADVKELRRGLTGEDPQSDSEGMGRRSYQPGPAVSTRAADTKTVRENEFEERAASDEENSEVNGDIGAGGLEVILDHAPKKNSISPRGSANDQHRHHHRDSNHLDSKGTSDVVENPWLSASTKKVKSRTIQDRQAPAMITSTPDMGVTAGGKTSSKPRRALRADSMKKLDRQNVETASNRPLYGFESDEDPEESHRTSLVVRNQELVRQAFAGDEVVAEFEKEKSKIIRDEEEKTVDNTLPGWGNWTGTGISKNEQKRNKGRFLMKEAGIREDHRKDARLASVIINEKRVKKVEVVMRAIFGLLTCHADTWQSVKYLASNLPHPFETKQQYERSLRLPVGPEWTTKETFQDATKPRIMRKQGVIAPMEKPMV